MRKKSNEKLEGEIIELEKIESKENSSRKIFNISGGFYYLLGVVISLILMFATEELLSVINYLFVVIFVIVTIVQIGLFLIKKEYINKNYSGLVIGIISMWISIFIFKYGSFIFLEFLPVLSSLILFVMAAVFLTKYLDNKKMFNLVISFISFVLGIALIFVANGIMYILFKITGCYILLLIILNFIDYLKRKK